MFGRLLKTIFDKFQFPTSATYHFVCHLLKYKYHLITRAIAIRCKGKELNQLCPSGRAIARYRVDICKRKPTLGDRVTLFISLRNICFSECSYVV